MSAPPITPGMRVAELLDAYPALEPVLVAQAPAFARLRNPVLRRTVARVATLEDALGRQGFEHWTRPLDGGRFQAYFRRAAD